MEPYIVMWSVKKTFLEIAVLSTVSVYTVMFGRIPSQADAEGSESSISIKERAGRSQILLSKQSFIIAGL